MRKSRQHARLPALRTASREGTALIKHAPKNTLSVCTAWLLRPLWETNKKMEWKQPTFCKYPQYIFFKDLGLDFFRVSQDVFRVLKEAAR